MKGNPPVDPDAAAPGFELAVLTTNVAVPLDGQATIELAITRTGGFTGEVSIAAVTPPNGLEVTALTVPGDADTAEVVVGALSPLAIGDTIDFNLEATATGLDAQTTAITDAEVTGRPGSLDVDFGVGTGYAAISFGSDDGGSLNALDVLGGNIIATGIGVAGLGPTRFSTMRFTAAGTADPTFNNGVLVRTAFNTGSTNESGTSAAIGHQLDGRPILIGTHQGAVPTQDLAIARLSTTGGSGGVDFGNSDPGQALFDLSGASDDITDGLVLADGRTVAVGQANGHHVIAIAQANGSALDGGFNTTGFLRDPLGSTSAATDVAVDSNGNLLVLGMFQGATDLDLSISRYTMAGLDTTFASAGRLLLTVSGTNEVSLNIVMLANDKFIVGLLSGPNLQIRRFNADGTPDTTFGTNGIAETPANNVSPRDMLAMPDGKIVFLGQTDNNAVLIRFRANGTLDPLFGTAGQVTVPFGDAAEVNTFIVYDNQKIVIAGGNVGGVPGPGTKGLIARVWM